MAFVFAVLLFLISGCGGGSHSGKAVTLTGKVNQAGEPVTTACIMIVADKSGAAFQSDLNEGGEYQVELLDTKAGDTFKVGFGPRIVPPEGTKPDGAGFVNSPPPDVPKKYQDPASSPLTVTLTGNSKQTADFDLDAK